MIEKMIAWAERGEIYIAGKRAAHTLAVTLGTVTVQPRIHSGWLDAGARSHWPIERALSSVESSVEISFESQLGSSKSPVG